MVRNDTFFHPEGMSVRKCLSLLFTVLIPLAVHSEQVAKVADIAITMPDDYRHVVGRGIDSCVGEITTASGMKIEYDLGRFGGCPPRLPEMSKDALADVLYFEDHPTNAPTGFLLVSRVKSEPGHPPAYMANLGLGEQVGSFSIFVTGSDKLAEARKALESLKVRHEPIPIKGR